MRPVKATTKGATFTANPGRLNILLGNTTPIEEAGTGHAKYE